MKARIVFEIEDGKPPVLEGPINNKLLMLGLLELAKDVLNEYHRNAAAAAQSRIETPRISMPWEGKP